MITVGERARKRLKLVGWLVGLVLAGRLALGISGVAVPAAGRAHPLRQAPTRDKVVALTFNISWGSEVPRLVLAALETAGEKATFFVSGPWAASHPELVREIVAREHEVASLGHRYVDLTTLSRQELEDDLGKAHRAIEAITGREPRFLRPPDGRCNELVLVTAADLGYTVVTWSLDSQDWKNPAPEQITRRVLSRADPGDIILFNASDSSRQIDRALPELLAELKERGFSLLTLSELLPADE